MKEKNEKKMFVRSVSAMRKKWVQKVTTRKNECYVEHVASVIMTKEGSQNDEDAATDRKMKVCSADKLSRSHLALESVSLLIILLWSRFAEDCLSFRNSHDKSSSWL